MDNNTIISNWLQAKAAADAAVQKEKDLREQINNLGIWQDKEEGSQTINLGNEYQLKLVRRMNVRVDNKDSKAANLVNKWAEEGPAERVLASTIFKWSPKLTDSVYRSLLPEQKALIDTLITKTKGMPSLELIPPKK